MSKNVANTGLPQRLLDVEDQLLDFIKGVRREKTLSREAHSRYFSLLDDIDHVRFLYENGLADKATEGRLNKMLEKLNGLHKGPSRHAS